MSINKNQVTIIFVHSGGNPIPECMIHSVAIASKVAAKSKILILTNAEHINTLAIELIKHIDIGHNDPIVVPIEGLAKAKQSGNFAKNSKSDRAFRNGFWFETSNRFMLIADLMRALDLENCLHLENDNVIFFDPTTKIEEFKNHARFAIPFDRSRAIPGIVWFKDADIADDLARFFDEHSEKPDFDVLRAFCELRPGDTKSLPTMSPSYVQARGLNQKKYCSGYEEFGGVFDAAAIGQYLGGVHWMNNPNDTRFFVNESSDLDMRVHDFSWFRSELYRYPTVTFEEECSKILSIHAHSKDSLGVSPFNSTKVTDTDIFVTGERIQKTAETSISSAEITEFHGRENIKSKNLLEIPGKYKHPILENILVEKEPSFEFIAACQNSRSIFIYTHLLPYFKKFIAPRLEKPFVLISHNSDHAVTSADLELLNHPFLTKWFAQNVEFSHSKLEAIPIGLSNIQWGKDKMAELKAASLSYKKIKKIYANFNTTTHPSRVNIMAKIEGVNGITNHIPNLVYKDYIKALASHKFCICPRGNGIDTHRFWEAQYVDTIPILLRRDWTPAYSGLPVLLLDSWEELINLDLDAAYIKISCSLYIRDSLNSDWHFKNINTVLITQ
jgi:hypothetical protein